MGSNVWKQVQRLVRGLFGAPFQELLPTYGNPAPPELQVFEAKADAAQKGTWVKSPSSKVHSKRTRPARQDESLERE